MERVMMAVVMGVLVGGVGLWETGWIHRWDTVGKVLQVVVVAASIGVSWLWLRYWERVTAWLDRVILGQP